MGFQFVLNTVKAVYLIGNGLNMVWTNCKLSYLISEVFNVSVSIETLCGLTFELHFA